MKKVTDLPQGKFQSAVFQLSQALGDEGAGVFIRIDSDPLFRHRVAEYMIAGAPEMVPALQGLDYDGAVAIMGKDKIIGPKEVEKLFGITIDPELMKTAGHIPYKSSTLALYAKSHLLVFGCPVSVSNLAISGSRFAIRWEIGDIDGDEPVFLTSAPRLGWFLISKKPDIVKPVDDEDWVTVAEAYYMYSLHKETNRTHCFLQDNPVICKETVAGGEVYFGLGSCFWAKYGEGSYDYTILKNPQRKPKVNLYLRVVQPDNPLV
jgi:hypothetical protein